MNHLIQSLQDKLRNIARSSGKDFQLILTRYFHERLLFRISKSEHADNFCLKGGALMYAWDRDTSRPTLDLDLLSLQIRMDQARFLKIFCEICNVPVPNDGVLFDANRMVIAEIMEQHKYRGLQIKLHASLGNMRQLVKVDIGYGDVVTPPPENMFYPVLLEMDAPKIKAYSPETVIAEKFEAMIDLAESNSRLKDFYDVYQLLSQKRFNEETLKNAIAQTFKNRRTVLRASHPLFKEQFATDTTRNERWTAFLSRTKIKDSPSFEVVMETIRQYLAPHE